jgi:DNA topoisomerase-2
MSKSDLSKLYRKQSDIEHVLHNPDTYIGSIELVKDQLFLYVGGRIQLLPIDFIGGLYKLFDEAITNARDHYIRMNEKIKSTDIKSTDIKSYPVCKIDIHVNKETGEISILNDGNGIDVEIHPEYEIYIPELIFGHLRTSTNYNKEEKKIVGGKNGFGVKLIFAWSTYGKIETYDAVRGLKYTQEFKNNLSEILPPIIEKPKKSEKFYGLKSGTPYTKITFIPDYNRFGINGLNDKFGDDLISLFKKRSYDIAAFVGKTKVYFNDNLIPINSFEQLVNLYLIDDNDESPKRIAKQIYECANERWEYSVCLAHDGLKNNISYVNGICTHKGGKHVEYIINQITKKIIEVIEIKKKMKISPNIVKERLCIFLRCDIENPSFDSQTKEYLTTPYSKFGSNCTISETFIQKVLKMGIMDIVCSISEIKGIAELDKVAKKSDGKKSRKIYGIPKLIDANWAGTERSNLCSLILCEGDSAKAGVISGLTSEMRNIFGIFPLKGKLLNVRGESMEKILSNEEIANLKKILGLANKAVYNTSDIRKLRYGKVLILTDADVDGSHIKGLCINMFDVLWPSLLQVGDFIGYMNTPILKARKGAKELLFYNEGEYNIWKESQSESAIRQWSIKYYKGLGTSTGKEFREYFENNKIVNFTHTAQSNDYIDMMFNKKRPDDRKQFLLNYTGIDDPRNIMDTTLISVSYEEFINKELIIFSKYDCERSIPNIMDGFKTSNRKILYGMIEKNITSEIKVAQLGALIAQVSSYHHGEISLIGAIIGMAQDFVGSNNINLLEPKGQFGTRRQGGKDHASERYIFTNMSPITKKIFIEADNHILKYLDDDGTPVEPMYYAPIIPMCIVNSMSGIGTGFSTEILGYNPQEIIKYLQFKLSDKLSDNRIYPHVDKLLIPYYKNFKGSIIPFGDKFLILGNYTKLDKNRIHITELPIGLYTEDFRKILDTLMGEAIEKPTAKDKVKDTKNTKKANKDIIVKDYDDNSDDKNIDFIITLCDGLLEELESKIDKTKGVNLVYKTFHLATTGSTSNIHLFDAKGILKKYNNIIEIIDEYFITRLELYQVRKNYLIDKLTNELIIIENKVKYIREVLNGTIDIRRMKKDAVYKLLSDKEYIIIDGEYNYLIKLPMDSVTEEKIAELENKFESKKIELEKIKSSTIENMWLHELEELNIELEKLNQKNDNSMPTENLIKKNVKSKKNKIITK